MSNSNNNNPNAAEASFRRSYAAALAEALREAEERPPQPSSEKLCHETYVQLCTDDPPRLPASGCRALAKALPKQPPPTTGQVNYALSDRLVEGIVQVCQRISRDEPPPQQTETTTNDSNDNKDDSNENDELLPSSAAPESLLEDDTTHNSQEATSSAYATLSWTVFGKIPLVCCLSNDLKQCTALLGSYRGPALPPISPPNGNTEVVEEKETDDNDNAENRKEDDDDHDSLAEVWAAESDPSDYGFDSGYDPQQQLQELEQWAQSVQINPQQLSTSPKNTTWRHVAQAVTHLLRQLSFSKLLAGWSAADLRQERVAEQLSQLALTLLLPSSSSLVLKQHDPHHWQQLALQPLHVFRDAVAVHTNALLPEYLELLQNLIQIDHQVKQQQPTQPQKDALTIAPATWMGLGALSALCSSDNIQPHIPKLRKAVLQVSDDVTSILEQCRGCQSGEDNLALAWTCLALFQILVSTGSGASATSTSASRLTNPQAQTLLNSGLFREWLVWWETVASSKLKTAMEWNLFHLCATCPTLLGKYAWRYPGLAGQVTSAADIEGTEGNQDEDSSFRAVVLLWNLLGISLAGHSSASATLQWRNNKSPNTGRKPPPTVAECQQRAWDQYSQLCQRVVRIIEQWKEKRVQPQDAGSDDSLAALERDLQILHEFKALAEVLSQTLSGQFVFPVLCFQVAEPGNDKNGDKETKRLAVRQSTVAIQNALRTWIPTPQEVVAKMKLEDEAHADNIADSREGVSAPGDRMHRQRPRLEDDAVAMVRKSLKLLQSAIDTTNLTEGCAGHQQHRFSSKAD